MDRKRKWSRTRDSLTDIFVCCCSCTASQLCITYRSTLSMASGSGGGTWKQTPGKVFVFPSVEITSHLSLSELDFRVSFSPLDRESCMTMINKKNICPEGLDKSEVTHLSCRYSSLSHSFLQEATPYLSPSHTGTPPWWVCWGWCVVASEERWWCCVFSGRPASVRSSAQPSPPPGGKHTQNKKDISEKLISIFNFSILASPLPPLFAPSLVLSFSFSSLIHPPPSLSQSLSMTLKVPPAAAASLTCSSCWRTLGPGCCWVWTVSLIAGRSPFGTGKWHKSILVKNSANRDRCSVHDRETKHPHAHIT